MRAPFPSAIFRTISVRSLRVAPNNLFSFFFLKKRTIASQMDQRLAHLKPALQNHIESNQTERKQAVTGCGSAFHATHLSSPPPPPFKTKKKKTHAHAKTTSASLSSPTALRSNYCHPLPSLLLLAPSPPIHTLSKSKQHTQRWALPFARVAGSSPNLNLLENVHLPSEICYRLVPSSLELLSRRRGRKGRDQHSDVLRVHVRVAAERSAAAGLLRLRGGGCGEHQSQDLAKAAKAEAPAAALLLLLLAALISSLGRHHLRHVRWWTW